MSEAIDALDANRLLSLATNLAGAIVALLSNLFFLVTLALFMAFDTRSTERGFAAVRDKRPYLVDALVSFANGTRSYMAVSAGFGLIVAVIDYFALVLMGVPGAFVWAVLAFVTNFIPNIGFVIGVIPPALIALLEGGPGLMLGVIVVYSVINVVIQSVIQPRYVGDKVGLSPTITMLSLVFWAWALGALGALLAVPMSLLARALLVEADPDARWTLPLIAGKPDPRTEAEADRSSRVRLTSSPPAGYCRPAVSRITLSTYLNRTRALRPLLDRELARRGAVAVLDLARIASTMSVPSINVLTS